MDHKLDKLPEEIHSGISEFRYIALGLFLLVTVFWIFSGPIKQDLRYHNFADDRLLFGIPNTMDVISNAGFLVAGILGFYVIFKQKGGLTRLTLVYLIFFVGAVLTAIGSAYFHLAPDNMTLVWDRLPMTIGFMAFTTFVVYERYSPSLAMAMFPWLLVAGIASVVYWALVDDLRPYALVQFGPMLAIPIMIWKLKGPGTRWLWLSIVFYFAAAGGVFCIAAKLQKREIFSLEGS